MLTDTERTDLVIQALERGGIPLTDVFVDSTNAWGVTQLAMKSGPVVRWDKVVMALVAEFGVDRVDVMPTGVITVAHESAGGWAEVIGLGAER